jgi:hypothetical protein
MFQSTHCAHRPGQLIDMPVPSAEGEPLAGAALGRFQVDREWNLKKERSRARKPSINQNVGEGGSAKSSGRRANPLFENTRRNLFIGVG